MNDDPQFEALLTTALGHRLAIESIRDQIATLYQAIALIQSHADTTYVAAYEISNMTARTFSLYFEHRVEEAQAIRNPCCNYMSNPLESLR